MSNNVKPLYEFDEFRLNTENPSLWRSGELVPIYPKALKILILLINKKGEIVSRDELLETVWQETFVEEANITYTVSQLRKALGKKNFIQTVPKRGYRFVVNVREVFENSDKAERRSELFANSQPSLNSSPKQQTRWYLTAIILLGVIFLTSFAVWWSFDNQRGLSSIPISDRNIRTVAVLPLKTLNESEASRVLALGLTDSLISRMGSLNQFAVRPLSSVGGYADSGRDPIKFGEELKVDAVLEGTLQTVDNRLRVSIRLWDVRDGAQLWQDSFDSSEANFFNLQDTISNRVMQSFVSQMIKDDRDILTRRETENRDAFNAYWRGRFYLEKRDTERAAAEFQEAINLDPNYALAYTGLADAYIWRANFTSDADTDFYRKAKIATERALELDPRLADAHSSLGRIKYNNDWDWQGAEESFRRAIELNSNSVNAHQFYSRLLTTLGRYDQALSEMYKARELDPRSADLGVPLSGILEKQGRYDESIKVLEEALEMDKDSKFVRRCIGNGYHLKGDYRKVIELGEEIFSDMTETDFWWASMLATAYYKTGQMGKANTVQQHLEKLAEHDPKSLYFLALHYSEIERIDEAVAALQKCLKSREERMLWTKNEPRFANLKNDPRFQLILRHMKLVE